MKPTTRQLAKIKKAGLTMEPVLSFWVSVNYEEGCSQNIGGYALDSYDKATKGKVGTACGCEIIRRLLLELQVNDFSEMAGKMLWVYGTGEGFGFKPTGIKRLYVDGDRTETLFFEDIYEQFRIGKTDETE